MKRIIFAVSLLLIFFMQLNAYADEIPDISAECAVVYCCTSGEVLYDKSAYSRHSMASTTKIMTAVIALESGKLNDEIIVGNEILAVEGTSLGLKAGDTIDLYSVVMGMMLASGNDAANVIANYLSGNNESFAVQMNNKADMLGMIDTSFVTPSGLDADEHFSTAYDMAKLSEYALNVPYFKEIVSSEAGKIACGGKLIYVTNHNKLLYMYDGCIGIKTGFTKKSGRCLVSAVERGGAVLICVTLNAPDDWNDHIKLYDYCFGRVSSFNAPSPEIPAEIKICGGEKNAVPCILAQPLTYYASSEIENIKTEIYTQPFLYPPVKKNDIIGKAVTFSGSKIIATSYILAGDNVSAANIVPKRGIKERIKDFISGWFN